MKKNERRNYFFLGFLMPLVFLFSLASCGRNDSNDPSSSQSDALSAPGDLTVEIMSDSLARLEWSDSNKKEQGFIVESSKDGVTFVVASEVPADTVYAVIHMPFVENQEVSFRVRAKGASGYSEYSRIRKGKYKRDQSYVELVFVEGGSFEMGNKNGIAEEKQVHKVTLNSFYISKYEITYAQYDAFCDSTKKIRPGDNGWGRGQRPVTNVSYSNAQLFCNWLGKRTGKTYRLPTEAEWEYAARGGNKSGAFKFSGSNNIAEVAWYSGNSQSRTHVVGARMPNELGLYDMSGNVWEWCSDWYDKTYYSLSPEKNPMGPYTGSERVIRGGNLASGEAGCLTYNRYYYSAPANSNALLGFRIVMIP